MASEVELIREEELDASSSPEESLSSVTWLSHVQLLYANRRTLYKTALWALIISTAFALLTPKHFLSVATIMPPESLGGMNITNSMMMAALAGKTSPGLAAMAGNVLGMKSTGALFVDLLRSRTVEDNIVDKFNLQKVYWARYKQDARKILDERTSISEDRKSGVIRIEVMDHNAKRSHDLAQAFVEELNKIVALVSTSSARRERMFIEQRLISVKSDLEDAEKQFSQYASKNTTLDIASQGKAMVEAGAVLQGQLIAAQSELDGLQQIYASNNVRVRAAKARMDELKRQLEKMGGTDASLASEGPAPGELYPPIRKLPLLGVQWADLYRRMKIQETVYELLNQQYELARIQEAKEIPTVNVIDPANIPEKKSWPPTLLLISLLTLLAVAGAAAIIIGSDAIRFLEPDDPRRQFAMSAQEVFLRLQDRVSSSSARHHQPNGSKPSREAAN